jgi:Tol biopolymer transport system component
MPDLRRARRLALTASAALLLPAVGASSVNAAEPPPGRAYELVSPRDTGGIPVYNTPFAGFAQTGVVVASEDGERVNYSAFGSFAGSASSGVTGLNSYLAERRDDGWETSTLQPPLTWLPALSTGGANLRDVTPDLAWSVIASNQPLAPGVPERLLGKNLFLRSTADGSYTRITALPAGSSEDIGSGNYGGMSDDGRHVVYFSGGQAGGPALFEWADGETRIVTAGARATLLQPLEARFPRNRVISGDGSRIAYSATVGGVTDLFVRIDGTTVRNASASRRTPAGAAAPQTFHGLSRDGGTVWFSSRAELTDDANTGAGLGTDLYRYDVDADTLTDVSVSAHARGAEVAGVVGLSDDGSTAYFVARNAIGGEGTDGGWNLFVARDGETRLVAELLAADDTNWSRLTNTQTTARVTPDGEQLLFVSRARPTGYDNRHAVSGAALTQVFRFDATAPPAEALTCVSCNPSGARPLGASSIQGLYAGSGGAYAAGKLPRNISDDGSRVFFDSGDALLPAAKNGRQNVYLWEDGELRLLSSGSSAGDARFGDASASGDDAFLTTDEALIPAEPVDAAALWDARVGGGFPLPPGVPVCSGDACQGPPSSQPPATVPGSFTHVGRGNVDEPLPPRVTVKVAAVSAAARRAFARTGRLTLKVTVSGAGKVTATGTAKLPGASRATRVVTASRTAGAAQTLRIPLRLSAAARRALARGRSLSVRLDVRHAGAAGVRRTTLRLPGAARSAKRSVNSSTKKR